MQDLTLSGVPYLLAKINKFKRTSQAMSMGESQPMAVEIKHLLWTPGQFRSVLLAIGNWENESVWVWLSSNESKQ